MKRLENNDFNIKDSNLHVVIDKIIDKMLKKINYIKLSVSDNIRI